MNSDILDYELPQEAIAQFPHKKRDEAKLLVVDRRTQTLSDMLFKDLPDILGETQYSIFRNDASVLKARIYAQKPEGGAVECLLLSPVDGAFKWNCMLRPGRRLKAGATFGVKGAFEATVESKGDDGRAVVDFHTSGGISVVELSQRIGVPPLPPYIRRNQNSPDYDRSVDNEYYETVYADPSKRVAAAAPTAGMHFTKELDSELEKRGHRFFNITLHVGIGTFQPLKSPTIEEHKMHSEIYEIPPDTLAEFRGGTRPKLAVGTTSIRALEDYRRKALNAPQVSTKSSYWGEADIFIYPPQRIGCADALITNFHLPRSTLLCLVASFLRPGETDGIDWLKEIYARALKNGYMFFSYGDAMLIL